MFNARLTDSGHPSNRRVVAEERGGNKMMMIK